MNKQAPTAGRLLVMVGFALSVFGLLLYLWLAFGGPIPLQPKGYRVTASFGEATQLTREADVRISGVPVGRVKEIELGVGGRALATIELDADYAPLPRDARATLRQKTLLGETYVELTPGTRNGPAVPDGGALATGQVSPTVELDEIFRAFDRRTRAAFQTWMQSLAISVDGRGRDFSETIGNLGPLAEDGAAVLRILNSQEGAVQRLVANSGEVFAALTERQGQLRGLITNSDHVLQATGARDRELAEAFVALPTFERESRQTLQRLTRFAKSANPLVTQLRPAARELSPTLVDLAETAPDLEGLFRDLDPLIDASAKGLPAVRRLLDDLRPVISQLDPFLRQVNPIVEFLGRYRRELSGFFSNTVASTQASDRPPNATERVHYLRTTNPINLENLAAYPERLPTNRSNPYHLPNSFDDLANGLKVYENRHCGVGGLPLLGDAVAGLLPESLRTIIDQLVLAPTNVFAPPCVGQGPFDVGGVQSTFPRVRAGAAQP